MKVNKLIEKLKDLDQNMEVTKELLEKLIPKTKNRPSGIKYKKSQMKRKQNLKKLGVLVYNNFNFSNKELAEKLGISEKEFYRSNFNTLANELKNKYKKQSLF